MNRTLTITVECPIRPRSSDPVDEKKKSWLHNALNAYISRPHLEEFQPSPPGWPDDLSGESASRDPLVNRSRCRYCGP